MDIESWSPSNPVKKESWRTVLTLAYQSLGVVYGDLSTSPLYVYKSTFAEDIQHSESNEEIYGVFSFVFWTLTLIPLLKYVFIVLRADDNGEGGTFALYSLLCRHARVSTLPNGQLADEELYEYKKDGIGSCNRGLGLSLKSTLEKHRLLQKILLTLALIGTCMVIGDGVLTPAISVFSAVSGLELVVSKHHHQYIEVPVACIILVFLFYLQHYGTHRIGFLFAPIVITWLFCISAIGVYNIFRWNPHVYQALSPYYMYKFLKKTQRGGWMSLGGILLCITGSEAMFADLGHFSQLSIKIAFSFVVYPSLILAYMGQAAYLSKNHRIESDYRIGFYESVPEKIRWPVLAIAILAAVVGSQAIITGTFSIIKQCSALGCFPRVKIIHTSSKICGQIYIPEINWTLMLLCLAVTVGFRDTKHISNASGLAVITVMLVTTCLMSLVIILCWNRSVILAICFIFFFGSIEALYFSASLIKFLEGAWVPVALSFIFLSIMYVWHYGTLKKYEFDFQNKVSINWLLSLGPNLGIVRVRGIGLIHTELVSGIPSIFSHFVTNLPAFHQVLVLFCIKYVPVPHVRPEERFLVGRIGPKEYRVYRCIARYGYRDVLMDDVEFEKDLVCSIAEFIRSEGTGSNNNSLDDRFEDEEKMTVIGTTSTNAKGIKMWDDDKNSSEVTSITELTEINSPEVPRKRVRFIVPESPQIDRIAQAELRELMEAREAGMAFILGHCYVKAKTGSSLIKRIVINVGYDFLRRNSTSPTYALNLPRASTLEYRYKFYYPTDPYRVEQWTAGLRDGGLGFANIDLPPTQTTILISPPPFLLLLLSISFIVTPNMAQTNAGFFPKDEDSIDDGVQEPAFFSRGYCCFFWYYPYFKYSRQSDYCERISSPERDFITRGWWNEGINAFKKARECSELVPGPNPKWKTFTRRFNKTPAGRSKSMKFHYDPLSYAMNFDEGPGHNCQFENHHSFRDFSSRYAANRGHKGQ